MGKTPLLPQDVVDSPPYCGSGLFVPYYPLRVEEDLYIAKTDTQATKRLEVFRNGYLISNRTYNWAQASIPISQFLNSYGLYSFVVKTETSFICSSQNTAEYAINYTGTSVDLIPPSITRIDCYPSFIGNEHKVEVQLADNGKISSVSLFYSTDNGPYLPAALTNLGNNCFFADLTIPDGAQKLSLIVEASDGNGNKIRFTTDSAAVRGYETRIDTQVSGATITGELTVIGGSLLQPVYLKVKSNGEIMYTLTDAVGNFAFNVPPSSGFQIEMSTTGIYYGSSLVINFLGVQTEPADITSIPGGGWYMEGTDVVLTTLEHIDASSNTRYRFSYWDVDGTSQGSGVNLITVSMSVNHTATAHYITQYSVLFTQIGLSSDTTDTIVTVNGNTKSFGDLPFALWVDSDSPVTYSYNSPVLSTASGKRFRIDSVTGPGSPITVSAPATVTGNYVTQYSVVFGQTGLGSTATGIVAIVNGKANMYNDMPFIVWADSGSSVTYTYNDIVLNAVTGERFKLVSATGSASPIIVTGSAIIVGNYKTQHYLTIKTDPMGVATILGEGWYDEAASITLTAPTIQNYEFNYWDIDGAAQGSKVDPITVIMNAAHTATAHYASTSSAGGVGGACSRPLLASS